MWRGFIYIHVRQRFDFFFEGGGFSPLHYAFRPLPAPGLARTCSLSDTHAHTHTCCSLRVLSLLSLTHTYTYTYIYTYTHTYTHIYIYIYVCICMCIYVYVYVCICFMCVYCPFGLVSFFHQLFFFTFGGASFSRFTCDALVLIFPFSSSLLLSEFSLSVCLVCWWRTGSSSSSSGSGIRVFHPYSLVSSPCSRRRVPCRCASRAFHQALICLPKHTRTRAASLPAFLSAILALRARFTHLRTRLLRFPAPPLYRLHQHRPADTHTGAPLGIAPWDFAPAPAWCSAT